MGHIILLRRFEDLNTDVYRILTNFLVNIVQETWRPVIANLMEGIPVQRPVNSITPAPTEKSNCGGV